jgi:AcrR family transcriptional regulator
MSNRRLVAITLVIVPVVSPPKPRDEKILSAAAELFRRRGFSAVGVDEIGRHAGVSGPAIYRHFTGKGDILAALYDQGLDDLFARTSQTFEDPVAEVRFLVTQHAGAILANPKLASIWIREGRSLSAPDRRRFHRRTDAYLDRWLALIGRCHPDADSSDVKVFARSTLGAINSVMDWPSELRGASGVALLSEGVIRAMAVLTDSGPELATAQPAA